MREANSLRQRVTFQQGGHQRAVEGIAGGNGIYGLHFKAGHALAFALLARPDAAAAEGDDYRSDALIVQRLCRLRRILIALNVDPGQLFGCLLYTSDAADDVYQV